MADARLKGQESSVNMTQDGTTLVSLEFIQDTEITVDITKLQEGYLGQTTDQYDSVFHGVSGNFTIHYSTGDVYDVIQAIIDKATRRTPGTVFNFKTTLQFPNGDRKRIVLNDISFGGIPNAIPHRDQYASLKFEFSASNGRFI